MRRGRRRLAREAHLLLPRRRGRRPRLRRRVRRLRVFVPPEPGHRDAAAIRLARVVQAREEAEAARAAVVEDDGAGAVPAIPSLGRMSASQPQLRRDSSPRNIHVAAAAAPRFIEGIRAARALLVEAVAAGAVLLLELEAVVLLHSCAGRVAGAARGYARRRGYDSSGRGGGAATTPSAVAGGGAATTPSAVAGGGAATTRKKGEATRTRAGLPFSTRTVGERARGGRARAAPRATLTVTHGRCSRLARLKTISKNAPVDDT